MLQIFPFFIYLPCQGGIEPYSSLGIDWTICIIGMHVPAYDTAVTSGKIVKFYYSESFMFTDTLIESCLWRFLYVQNIL